MSKTHKGTCHCGEVAFEVELENGIESVVRCDCSYCSRRSAYMSYVPLVKLTVTKGKEFLTLYEWGTDTAKHYFCKNCGIYTHHQQRSNPNNFGFNIACIDGVDPYEFNDARINDGVNHPSDRLNIN